MFKFSIAFVLLICSMHLGEFRALAQEPLPIHVVAIKGDCITDLTISYVDGRPILYAGRNVNQFERPKTLLTRLDDDPDVREDVTREFKKNRSFKVVKSADQAKIVFQVCSSYGNNMIPVVARKQSQVPLSRRMFTIAMLLPAAGYKKPAGSLNDIAPSALWKDFFLSTGGTEPPEEASPVGYARKFLKESPNLMASLISQPPPRNVEPIDPPEQKRPSLLSNGDAFPANPQKSSEPATPEESMLKLDTSLVIVPVSAMDKDGKFVPGLVSKDFQLFENGIKQEITEFGSSEAPFHVALLIDTSPSTRFKIEDMQDAAISFLDQLRPQDQVMVVSFDNNVRVDTEFTNNRDRLLRAILRTRTGPGTRVYDALDLSLTERLKNVQGRKAIVVFTDGVDTTSRLSYPQDVITHVEESGVLVYSIRYDTFLDLQSRNTTGPLPPGNSKEDYEFAASFLKDLALRSGSRTIDVETTTDLHKAFNTIAEELRKQYWLGYYPENTERDGSYRRIKVNVDKPDIVIRSRQGYRAAQDSESPKPSRPVLQKTP
ncbi:MAG: VWA domain-containing protein [Acidobacteria bacterium]|nr:VWA domain-containing protein [Acidobacteriota bacterium]